MDKGTVKFFIKEKHFGSITREDGVEVAIVAQSVRDIDSLQLSDDQKVEFNTIASPKGPLATDIRVLRRNT